MDSLGRAQCSANSGQRSRAHEFRQQQTQSIQDANAEKRQGKHNLNLVLISDHVIHLEPGRDTRQAIVRGPRKSTGLLLSTAVVVQKLCVFPVLVLRSQLGPYAGRNAL
jgi:hypothetical protein